MSLITPGAICGISTGHTPGQTFSGVASAKVTCIYYYRSKSVQEAVAIQPAPNGKSVASTNNRLDQPCPAGGTIKCALRLPVALSESYKGPTGENTNAIFLFDRPAAFGLAAITQV